MCDQVRDLQTQLAHARNELAAASRFEARVNDGRAVVVAYQVNPNWWVTSYRRSEPLEPVRWPQMFPTTADDTVTERHPDRPRALARFWQWVNEPATRPELAGL